VVFILQNKLTHVSKCNNGNMFRVNALFLNSHLCIKKRILRRRIFIKKVFQFTMATFFVSKKISAVQNETPNNIWIQLIEYARWCPTVHNLQPQRVKIVSNTEAELYYDASRLLPHGDQHSIFATVAMGIFIEHLSIVAHSFSQQVVIEKVYDDIDHQKKGLVLFTKLKLIPTTKKEPLDKSLILKRRTSRNHYFTKKIEPSILEEITQETEKQGYQFHFSNKQDDIDFLTTKNEETLFDDLESEKMRTELNALFRYSKQEASDRKDGLWSRCMGFPGIMMKNVFHHFQRYEKGLLKKLINKYYHHSFKNTNTIAWIIGDFSNTEHYLQAGKVIARNWLLMTKHNVYMQPCGSLLTNEKMYDELCMKLNIKEPVKICMIMRMGYSKTPARSYRLETNDFIIQ
jgi:hypothetical protein